MIRQSLETALKAAVSAYAESLGHQPDSLFDMLSIERPRQREFGDYAVNVSPLAKVARTAPPQIAQAIAGHDALSAWSPNCMGGFINFRVPEDTLTGSLAQLVTGVAPGKNQTLADMRCLMEYVSANPTGPLHIGHGRWVALGDSLARIFRHCGATVTDEFYINDAGSQMFNIANSIWYRCLEILGTGGKLPPAEEGKPYPFYAADYVIEMAHAFLEIHREKVLAWDNPAHQMPEAAAAIISDFAKTRMLAEQRALIERCRLTFRNWFSEKELHASGAVRQTLETLQQKGETFERDGALWFASSKYGDDQDRVLVKSDGSYTYLTADIAYHDNKYRRDNGFYNRFINIWGADHHGYIPRMKASMTALGHDPERLEILLGQLVNLIVDGERTRMGKRRRMMTLGELVDEVGVDAVRFWMVSKSQDTALDFDVSLAASASEENPVFYVQYAHARCRSIFRNALSPRLDTLSGETLPPVLAAEDWPAFQNGLSPKSLGSLWTGLENEQATQALRELVLKLDSFTDRVIDAARLRSPHMIARYLEELAGNFHHFYNVCRIVVPANPQTTLQRLTLIEALSRVIAQGLDLLGVSAPEQM